MKRYIIVVAMALFGLSFFSCSDSSNDNTAKMLLLMNQEKTPEKFIGTEIESNPLHFQYSEVYQMDENDENISETSIRNAWIYNANGELKYCIKSVLDKNVVAPDFKASYYVCTADESKVIYKYTYEKNETGKFVQQSDWDFYKSPKTKEEAVNYPGLADSVSYKKYKENDFSKIEIDVNYAPSDNYKISFYEESTYDETFEDGDTLIEKKWRYIPYNIKWDESTEKAVIIDSSVVKDNKITLKNFKEEEKEFDFPIYYEYQEFFQKANSDNPYDYSRVIQYEIDEVKSAGTGPDNYQYSNIRNTIYEFYWDSDLYSDAPIQSSGWAADENWIKTGERNSTMVVDFEKFSFNDKSAILPSKHVWLDTDLKKSYYYSFMYEPILEADGSATDRWFQYDHKYYALDTEDSDSKMTLKTEICYDQYYDKDGKLCFEAKYYADELPSDELISMTPEELGRSIEIR